MNRFDILLNKSPKERISPLKQQCIKHKFYHDSGHRFKCYHCGLIISARSDDRSFFKNLEKLVSDVQDK
jgi:hypothetical protein